jgi:hypothetical protein
MVTESASLTTAAPSATVTPVYLPIARRYRPLTGKLLDELTEPPKARQARLNMEQAADAYRIELSDEGRDVAGWNGGATWDA